MKVDRVSFRRVYNLGNYETIAIEMEAVVEEGEKPVEVLRALSREVKSARKSQESDE